MKIKNVPIIGHLGKVLKKFWELAEEQRMIESERDYQERKAYLEKHNASQTN